MRTHWDQVETPHLFKKDRMIVIVGDHTDVQRTLEAILGPQLREGRRP